MSSGYNSRTVIFLRLWRRPLCRRAHHPRRCQESWLQSGSGGDEDVDEDGAAALDDDNEHEDVQITETKWQVEVTDDLSTWHQADGQPKGTSSYLLGFRVVICRDRHDWQSCKICASCKNAPGKQRDFLHNLRRTARFTHTKCDFALQLLKFRYESPSLIRTA